MILQILLKCVGVSFFHLEEQKFGIFCTHNLSLPQNDPHCDSDIMFVLSWETPHLCSSKLVTEIIVHLDGGIKILFVFPCSSFS